MRSILSAAMALSASHSGTVIVQVPVRQSGSERTTRLVEKLVRVCSSYESSSRRLQVTGMHMMSAGSPRFTKRPKSFHFGKVLIGSRCKELVRFDYAHHLICQLN